MKRKFFLVTLSLLAISSIWTCRAENNNFPSSPPESPLNEIAEYSWRPVAPELDNGILRLPPPIDGDIEGGGGTGIGREIPAGDAFYTVLLLSAFYSLYVLRKKRHKI